MAAHLCVHEPCRAAGHSRSRNTAGGHGKRLRAAVPLRAGQGLLSKARSSGHAPSSHPKTSIHQCNLVSRR